MSDGKVADIKPIDIAEVWGTAFGQLVDLWKNGLKALLEAGKAEDDVQGSVSDTVTTSMTNGVMPVVKARNMKGESFGAPLKSESVKFTPRKPVHDKVTFECAVVESLAGDVPGDIYRGEAVADGQVVGLIALDAGS